MLPRLNVSFSMLFLCAAVIGCAQPMPRYPAVEASEAIRLMAERSRQVKTLSSRCRFVLTRADGRSIELEGAFAAKPPDHFRFRAWKVSQPVFDLTLRPDGMWLHVAERPDSEGKGDAGLHKALNELTADRFVKAWAVFGGEFDADAWKVVADGRKVLRLSREGGPDGHMVCDVSRPELTLRRCEMHDLEGGEQMTLQLDRYRNVQGVLWPTRISFRSAHGNITIVVDDPIINEELATAVFEPPSRAVRKF